jgi:hypothetical protein
LGATFEPIVGFVWNFYEGDDIEDDLYSIIHNPVPSTISK